MQINIPTCPIWASIVQNGKFAACAFALLKQLKRVDFPTLGRPTIPAFNAIVLSCFLVIVQLIGCKDSANRMQNKMNSFIFYAEVQPIFTFLSKDSTYRGKWVC